jgi:hypothetical protein
VVGTAEEQERLVVGVDAGGGTAGRDEDGV